jgi:hypothetical protein
MSTADANNPIPVRVPPGYDSELLEALENPLGMRAREEDEDFGQPSLRTDSLHGLVQPNHYLYP